MLQIQRERFACAQGDDRAVELLAITTKDTKNTKKTGVIPTKVGTHRSTAAASDQYGSRLSSG
jgi:hypothetical protein